MQLSAVFAWPVVLGVIIAHYVFNPFKSETGGDALMLIVALPAFLFGYGFWMGLIHIPFARYRTKELIRGFLLHCAGAVVAMFVMWQAGVR